VTATETRDVAHSPESAINVAEAAEARPQSRVSPLIRCSGGHRGS
jgi:hypothetical protein